MWGGFVCLFVCLSFTILYMRNKLYPAAAFGEDGLSLVRSQVANTKACGPDPSPCCMQPGTLFLPGGSAKLLAPS